MLTIKIVTKHKITCKNIIIKTTALSVLNPLLIKYWNKDVLKPSNKKPSFKRKVKLSTFKKFNNFIKNSMKYNR